MAAEKSKYRVVLSTGDELDVESEFVRDEGGELKFFNEKPMGAGAFPSQEVVAHFMKNDVRRYFKPGSVTKVEPPAPQVG